MYVDVIKLESSVFKALANSKRLQIIYSLYGQEMSVGEIVKKNNLPQANISQHLMVLRKAKLLSTKKIGKKIFYHVTHPMLMRITDMIKDIKHL